MHALTFANLKGGTAKTTSCAAIGAELARRGRPTLLVDLDHQANLTFNLGMDRSDAIIGVLEGEKFSSDTVQATPYEDLDIVTSSRKLHRFSNSSAGKISRRLQSLFEAAAPYYDFVLVDTHPSQDHLLVGAIATTVNVVVPVQAGRSAIEGTNDLMRLMHQTGTGEVIAAFVTMVDNRTLHDAELFEYLKENLNVELMEQYISYIPKAKEAETQEVPLTRHAPNSRAAKEYVAVTDELIQKLEPEKETA